MNSILFSALARLLWWPLLALSLLALLRGHNDPGGGFIGGLMAASAWLLLALADGTEAANRRLPVNPLTLAAVGMLLAVISMVPGLLAGGAWMEAVWLPAIEGIPFLGKLKLGTPFIFDIGVFLVVIGFTLEVVAWISQEEERG